MQFKKFFSEPYLKIRVREDLQKSGSYAHRSLIIRPLELTMNIVQVERV